MKTLLPLLLITVYLSANETIPNSLVIEHCKNKAESFNYSERIYNHVYSSCMDKAKTYTSKELENAIQDVKKEKNTIEKNEKNIAKNKIKFKKNILGTWLVYNGNKYKQTYFFRGNQLYSQTLFSDGSGSTEEVKYKKLRNGTIKIPDIDPYGVYCLITPDKKLEFWGSTGNFLTANLYKEKDKIKKTKKLYVGQKVPYHLWDEYGYPETLRGTNNTYWIVYLPKINMTFKSKKTTDIILVIKTGKVPNL